MTDVSLGTAIRVAKHGWKNGEWEGTSSTLTDYATLGDHCCDGFLGRCPKCALELNPDAAELFEAVE